MEAPVTLSLEEFWTWLCRHSNCILRAGTMDTVLYDDEEYHWHLGSEDAGRLVQVVHGKRLVGEILLDPERVAYVQEAPAPGPEEDEHSFELISELDNDSFPTYFFVLSHGYENQTDSEKGRVH